MQILHDIAMIAADTSRSRAYIQALLSAGIAPSRVFLLEDANRLGQTDRLQEKHHVIWGDFCPYHNLKYTLDENRIVYHALPSPDINSPETIEKIASGNEPFFIYSGFGGVILRTGILNTGKEFLHIHGGYLPHYKGSTTNYYSFLKEGICGASSIFLRKQLDSGPLLMRRLWHMKTIQEMDYILDSVLRAQVLLDTIQYKLHHNSWPSAEIDTDEESNMYYIMHPLLRHIALFGI